MELGNQYEYWDKVANDKVFTHPVDFELLSKYVGKSANILDYGCGYGRVVQTLAAVGYNNVAGYDTSAKLIERGRSKGLGNIFHIETATDLPVSVNSVDCILLFAVLTCIPPNKAQADLAALLYEKLKPGGIIYVSDYYLQRDLKEVGRYGTLNDDPENFGVFHLPEGATFRHHTRDWIMSLFGQFVILDEIMVKVKTMNGHKADAFQLIARKVA